MSRSWIIGVGTAVVALLFVGALGAVAKAWYDSRLPGTYSVMDYGDLEYGGGTEPTLHPAHHGVSVATLRGPRSGAPDKRFVLNAKAATVRLASGREVEALTFDGRAPGPELRVRQGDLVEVTLSNEDIAQGVTIHWHGVDVPNGEDGVAGVTQDAVLPGESHTYRFRAEQVGTFWYHTHQASSSEVRRGLFGALVIEPTAGRADLDLAVVAHTFDIVPTLNGDDRTEQRAVPQGTQIRLRLVNTDSTPQRFTLVGTDFRVVALDGTDLNDPSPLRDRTLEVAAGGRLDVAFAMPATPVLLSLGTTSAALVLSSTGRATPPTAPEDDLQLFDPTSYGRPAPTPFHADGTFDRHFRLTIGRKPGFLDGRPGMQWAINGRIYPDVPMFVVERGDLVHMTVENDTDAVHPMHLHGHHLLVLSRDGEAVTGSPWWTDTLDVKPGQRYELAFRADNPGIWMDHCHNLRHAAEGLTMHVAYAGVTTPFRVGDHADNHPE